MALARGGRPRAAARDGRTALPSPGVWPDLLHCLLAYFVGGISFAVLAGRLRGVDVRAHGSGNPGATNVARLLGRGWGRAVLVADILKGLLAVTLLTAWPGVLDRDGRAPILAAVVIGHIAPITSGFRGGKGVAAFVGGILAYDPVLAAVALAIHVAVRRATRFVSLASVALVIAFPLLQWLAAALAPETAASDFWATRRTDGQVVTIGLAVLITLRHAGNFARMSQGSEHRAPGDDAGAPASRKGS